MLRTQARFADHRYSRIAKEGSEDCGVDRPASLAQNKSAVKSLGLQSADRRLAALFPRAANAYCFGPIIANPF